VQVKDRLTHLDEHGRAKMVDVSSKSVTTRRAKAEGLIRMTPDLLERIFEGDLPKGDVLAVARVACVLAAKRTSELIPLCHPLPIESLEVTFEKEGSGVLRVVAEVGVTAKTGAEMEALTAVSVAALTVYDMCKAVDRAIEIDQVHLVEKSGGKSGHYRREG
jgi:cyclic pyranopterin phosphate synthase